MALDKVSYHLESAINDFWLSEKDAYEWITTYLGFFLWFVVASNFLSDDYPEEEIIEMKKLLWKDNFDLVKLVSFYFDDQVPESFFKEEYREKLITYYNNQYTLYDYEDTFEDEALEVKPTKENFDKIFRVIYKKFNSN